MAGYLAHKGADVVLVGRPGSAEAIRSHGLRITGVRGELQVRVSIGERLSLAPEIAVLATKTQDIEEALRSNQGYLQESLMLTTQNGVRADAIAARFVPRERIVSSIVMFGATYLEPGHVVHNFEGNWIMGKGFPSTPDTLVQQASLMASAAFSVEVTPQLSGMKYLKIFVNANNCIPAILGTSMQEAFADAGVSRVSVAIWREGLEVVRAAGITLHSMPHFPVENVTKLCAIPLDEAARVFSGLMGKLSREPLYGSILQSIKRGRASEIEYINGEFVRLAQAHGKEAPLNAKLVAMVHEVEKREQFLSREAFLEQVQGLCA